MKHRPEHWTDAAACREVDPELFFPASYEVANEGQVNDAKAVCHDCPVVGACLTDALDKGDRFGIRGALTPRERERIARVLRPKKAPQPAEAVA